MKILIVEDDFTCRFLLQQSLKSYGTSHIAVNGKEAVEAIRTALESGEPYQLVCMDIMMPEMDGTTAVRKIRALEEAKGVPATSGAKIIMTTALDELSDVGRAYQALCDGYLVKPINGHKLVETLRKLELIK